MRLQALVPTLGLDALALVLYLSGVDCFYFALEPRNISFVITGQLAERDT